jgi:hypothetical protein
MGSAGEEEREARSEAAFTDSASTDGSSSSSDAASTDEWLPAAPVPAARKPGGCASDTDVARQQHKHKRRAPSGEPPSVLAASWILGGEILYSLTCARLVLQRLNCQRWR